MLAAAAVPGASAAPAKAGATRAAQWTSSVGAAARMDNQTAAGRPGRRVIVIGIAGLRWSDISVMATPAIWRLAQAGSVGSLATKTIHTVTCPADAWLTLNSGIRAAAQSQAGGCQQVPVVVHGDAGPASAVPATIPSMRHLTSVNKAFDYGPVWGDLATAAGPGQCATAVGPGAALALADSAGRVGRYRTAFPPANRYGAESALLSQCPLTVIDLGVLPASAASLPLRPGLRSGAASARGAAVAGDDRVVGEIAAAAPAGSTIMLAGLGDDGVVPQLRAIVVSGPGFRHGLLSSASTRQPGVVAITDLTPTVLRWRGRAVPSSLSQVTLLSVGCGSLSAAVKTMIGQNTADQVYRSIVGWFFLYYGVAEAVLFALIAVALRGSEEFRVRRRVAWYTAAGVFSGAVPAGTFLAGLAPWAQWSHPAVWLYGLGLAWAAVIAVPAAAGPWRRSPYGPVGFVGAVTLAAIGIDVMTGSRLQLGAPFGISLVEAGRYYGLANNAFPVYATAAMFAAAWAANAARRRAPIPRWPAVAAAGSVALVTIVISGWPGFGAKVGGTIAAVPAFLVLLAAVGGVRITWRRGLIVAVSGFAVVAVFAVLNYLGVAALSHQGDFVGQLLHGGAGGTLHRKVNSNLSTVFQTWYTPIVPVVAAGTGVMIGWPGRLRLRTFVSACSRSAWLRTTLFAVWLVGVLAWFVEDSGVSVAAAALPIALPLGITLVLRVAHLTPGSDDTPRRAAPLSHASRPSVGPAVGLWLPSAGRR